MKQIFDIDMWEYLVHNFDINMWEHVTYVYNINVADVSIAWNWALSLFILSNSITSLIQNESTFMLHLADIDHQIQNVYGMMSEFRQLISIHDLTSYLTSDQVEARYEVVLQLHIRLQEVFHGLLELQDLMDGYGNIVPYDLRVSILETGRKLERILTHVSVYHDQLYAALQRM